MDNPLRYLVGGVQFDLPLDLGEGEVRRVLADAVVDPISELMEVSGPARTALLAGTVEPDRVRLRTPRRVRAPFWPLSPVLRGRLLPQASGGSVLESRLYILKWPLVFGLVFSGTLLAQPYSPLRWYGGAVVVLWLVEFVFVLPRTKEELVRRVRLATTGTSIKAPPIR